VKYYFQSLNKLEICGKPVINFYNFEYETEDGAIANRIRNNSRFGIDMWEVTPEVYKEKIEAATLSNPQKRRGRPPKIQIVTGSRTSELQEKHE